MINKPIIGIIGKVQPKYDEDLWHRIDEVDEIRYLIVKNGGIAIILLPTEVTMKFNDNDISKLNYVMVLFYKEDYIVVNTKLKLQKRL